MRMLNKKGQVGETMTWIVATLIIVFLLVSSVYVASLLGETKFVKRSVDSAEEYSIVNLETSNAYSVLSENKDFIMSWIEEDESE